MAQPTLTIHATPRTALGRAASRIRKAGEIPAVVYGRGTPSRPLAVGATEFARVYRDAGESTILDLLIDGGQPVKALIQEVAHDPLTGAPVHVDFHAVSMTEKIRARIPLAFTGIAPVVKDLGGVLVKQCDHVEVEALASALVHEITVDLAPLATLESVIRIRDLKVPAGIALAHAPDDIVVSVTEAQKEAVSTAVSPESVEVVGAKGKEVAEGEGAEAGEKSAKVK